MDLQAEVETNIAIMNLIIMEAPNEPIDHIFHEILSVIKFFGCFPKDLLNRLPFLRDIQHAFNLAPRIDLPYLTHFSIECHNLLLPHIYLGITLSSISTCVYLSYARWVFQT